MKAGCIACKAETLGLRPLSGNVVMSNGQVYGMTPPGGNLSCVVSAYQPVAASFIASALKRA